MADVESAVTTVQTFQQILLGLAALSMTAYRFPADTATDDLQSSVDYIIIGGGTAGCVVANRLSADTNNTVLVIEAGDVPPIESMLAGMFTLEPNANYDWNRTSKYDGYTSQSMVDKVAAMTAGKMLGGTSGLNHMIQVRGNKDDYDNWVNITGDSAWSYGNNLPYFIKFENVLDDDIINTYPSSHGTSGPLKLKTQPSSKNVPILEAFKELNHTILVDINNANESLGYLEPQLTIADGIRYSSSAAYLTPILNRTNLSIKYNTLATKIIFDSNNRAIGVEIMDSDNINKTIYVNKEIIVSAGAIKSPQLLILSGIGEKETLDNLGIDIISELPVGKHLKDHTTAVTVYTLGKTNTSSATNYHEFPVPMTTGYVSLNSSKYPHYQTINLLFPQSSSGLLQLCAWVFKYNNDICQEIYDANKENEVLFVVNNIMRPYSEGVVTVNSTDPSVNPEVSLGLLSNEIDLEILTQSLMDYNSIVNSSYFKSVNSSMLHLNLTNCNDLEKTSYEYFKCYALAMSTSMWHQSSTCRMGSVLNSDMTVKNTTNLRVADASAMPDTISGNIQGAIYLIGEKVADLILKANS